MTGALKCSRSCDLLLLFLAVTPVSVHRCLRYSAAKRGGTRVPVSGKRLVPPGEEGQSSCRGSLAARFKRPPLADAGNPLCCHNLCVASRGAERCLGLWELFSLY